MAEVNAKDLTTKTSPASTDSMLLFGTTSNEGAKITVDNLADNILSRLSTKTFANQVGGSSAATLLSQLSTLNSNMAQTVRFSSYSSATQNKPVLSFTVSAHAGFILIGYNSFWYGTINWWNPNGTVDPVVPTITKIYGANVTFTIDRDENAPNHITFTGSQTYQNFSVILSSVQA